MKTKTLVLGGLLLLSTVSFSQTEKGNYILSGRTSIDFVRNSSNLSNNGTQIPEGDVDMNTFKLLSDFGYFVADNFALCLSGVYSHTRENIYKSNELVLMPTLIYYIPLNSAFRPYAQIGVGYANASEKSDIEKEFFSGFAYGGGIGVAYFITKNIAVDFGIQLVATKLTYSEDDNVKINGANLGSALGLSLFF